MATLPALKRALYVNPNELQPSNSSLTTPSLKIWVEIYLQVTKIS